MLTPFILSFILSHGFEPFVNADNETVSFYLADNQDHYTLVTVATISEAREALGY